MELRKHHERKSSGVGGDQCGLDGPGRTTQRGWVEERERERSEGMDESEGFFVSL